MAPPAAVNLRREIADGAVLGAAGGLKLRFARDDDATAIIELIAAVWSEYPGKTLVAAADMPELLHPASAYGACDGRFWVMEAHGRIVGTVALQPSAEAGVVELQKLYVARDMRRNGLGGFLCHLVEREARRRGARAIELWSDIKLVDAHRRYESLGYIRGEALKTYDDTSGTVRYYYRKSLHLDAADGDDDGLKLGDRWQAMLHDGQRQGGFPRNGIMKRLSFTEHPASVGENYLQHLRHATGFAVSMIGGGLAVAVHAVLPFLFKKTGSGIIADLHTRMVTNRRQLTVKRSAAQPAVAQPRGKRISAA
jgi:N-acetylglutamate synthase-like GNAT family acetyltransferase